MFDNRRLMEWAQQVFVMSHKYNLAPSEIDMMPYFEYKLYLTLFNIWKDEKK